MKAKFTHILSFLLLLIFLSPVNAFADIFGSSDKVSWDKVLVELKKIHSRLVTLEVKEMDNLKNYFETMLREIEDLKYAVPQLQGVVESNKVETLSGFDKTNAKLDGLAAEVKNPVLGKIHQNLQLFRKEQKSLKEGLAQDIEEFEQSSKTNFQEFSVANKKGFDDTIALFRTDVIPAMAMENQKSRKIMLEQLAHASTETQKTLEAFSSKNKQLNQKLIEILEKSLKQGLDTKSLLDSIKKDLKTTHTSAERTNNQLLAADKKINVLAEGLKAQNTVSNEALGALKAELEQAGKFNKLADEKLNKLIDLSSTLATYSTEIESSVVGQLKDLAQKEDARTTKVDLANEEFSRLIEILKVIAEEQAKLGPVATALGNMQKEQVDLKKTQGEIKEALADLRRKANVNLSRNDDIKKTLGQLSSTKSKEAGGQ